MTSWNWCDEEGKPCKSTMVGFDGSPASRKKSRRPATSAVLNCMNAPSNSVRREGRVRREKGGRLAREGLMKLEQRTVSGVGIGKQDSVREVLAQCVGIRDGNHFVANAVDDQRRLADLRQICEALTRELFPLAEGGDLGGRDLGSRRGFEIVDA